jgi:hypothetical protein
VFLIVYIGFGTYSYTVWYDSFPIIAVCIGTIAFFYLEGIATRLCLVCATCLWLIHNIVVGSIGPILMEIMNVCAHLITIYRLYRVESGSG